MSRRHAELRIMPDGKVVIRDLQSKNGTFLVRENVLERISESHVLPQDTLKFGMAELYVSDLLSAVPETDMGQALVEDLRAEVYASVAQALTEGRNEDSVSEELVGQGWPVSEAREIVEKVSRDRKTTIVGFVHGMCGSFVGPFTIGGCLGGVLLGALLGAGSGQTTGLGAGGGIVGGVVGGVIERSVIRKGYHRQSHQEK